MKRALWLILGVAAACDRGDSAYIVANGTLEIVEVDVAPLMTARVSRVLVD